MSNEESRKKRERNTLPNQESEIHLQPARKKGYLSNYINSRINKLNDEKQATFSINQQHKTLLSEMSADKKKPATPGGLTSQDYHDGYISDDGFNAITSIKNTMDTLDEDKVSQGDFSSLSRHGNKLFQGQEKDLNYYGVNLTYRVDMTEKTSKDKTDNEDLDNQQHDNIKRSKHARLLIDGKNITTQDMMRFSNSMGAQQEQSEFIKGIKGDIFDSDKQPIAPKNMSDERITGISFRAVIRASEIGHNEKPLLDGFQMSRVQNIKQASNLFHHDEFNTGAIGSQNSSKSSTGEYNKFKQLTQENTLQRKNTGKTDINQAEIMRKAKSVNSAFPKNAPFVNIEVVDAKRGNKK